MGLVTNDPSGSEPYAAAEPAAGAPAAAPRGHPPPNDG